MRPIKYKLIDGSLNNIHKAQQTILSNRHIEDAEQYLHLTNECTYSYELLDDIDRAVECTIKHINRNSNIAIVVDCDADGYTSAAMLYMYLKHVSKCNITPLLHNQKTHGLTEDICIPSGTDIVFIPDAGTNDYVQLNQLHNNGIDAIVLDHHLLEQSSQSDAQFTIDDIRKVAIVVNNQLDNYPNKHFSGAGVTYKFLQAMDDALWESKADNYMDLMAVGNVADSMLISECETKYLCCQGMYRLRNKFLTAIVAANSFKMSNPPNFENISFIVAPIINAYCRVGSMEEKHMLFKALTEQDEMFSYKKRGEKTYTPETIYERVIRYGASLRRKQNKTRDEALKVIYESVEKYNLDQNKIIFCNVSGVLDQEYTGLAAIRVAEHYHRPCLLLRYTGEDKDTGEKYFGGSGRNIDDCEIENFNELLTSVGIFDSVAGHENAFGFQIKKSNINTAIQLLNEKLCGFTAENVYAVDFDIEYSDLDINVIRVAASMKNIYGKGFAEPKIAVRNIEVETSELQVMGKQSNTVKYVDEYGIAWIKFGCGVNDKLLQAVNSFEATDEHITFNAVCKMSMSEYKGTVTPQMEIIDYEVVK